MSHVRCRDAVLDKSIEHPCSLLDIAPSVIWALVGKEGGKGAQVADFQCQIGRPRLRLSGSISVAPAAHQSFDIRFAIPA